MAGEVELERMVVRITGDTAGVQRAYDQTAKGSRELQAKVGAIAGRDLKMPVPDTGGMEKASSALGDVHLRARAATRALGYFGQVSGMPPMMTHGATLLARSLTIGAGAALPLGAGLAAIAPAAVVGGMWLHRLYEQFEQARVAANKAFGDMSASGKTFQQTLSGMQVNTLSEGLNEAAEAANPGPWQRFRQVVGYGIDNVTNSIARLLGMSNTTGREMEDLLGGSVEGAVDRALERAQSAEAMLAQLAADPRITALRQQIGGNREQQAARDQATALEEQAGRSHLAGAASERFAMAQRLASVAGIELGDALRKLAPEFERMQAAWRQELPNRFRVDQLRELQNQIDLAGLGADAAQRLSFAQQESARSGASVQEVLQQLNPLMAEYVGLQNQRAAATFDSTTVRQFEEEADRAGLSENAARRMAMAQQEAFNRGVPLTEMLNRMAGSLNRIQEAQNTGGMNNFLRDIRMQGATIGLSSERARLFQMSLDGVSDANITAALAEVRHLEALRALQQGLEEIQGTRFGSAAALQTVAQYENRFTTATQAATIRQRLLQDQQLNQASPSGFGALAGSTAAAQSSLQSQAQLGVGPVSPPSGGWIGQALQSVGLPANAFQGGAPTGGLPGGPVFAQQVGPDAGSGIGDLAQQIAAAIQQGAQQQAQAQQSMFAPLAALITGLQNWLQSNMPAPVVGGGGPP